MIALKKINSSDVRQVVIRRLWNSGTTYDMYRHDYSRSNTAKISGATNLYTSSFYVINSEYSVYICLQNGTSPDNPNGKPSLDEPLFKDLEPRLLEVVVMVIFGNTFIVLNQTILLNLSLQILSQFPMIGVLV